MDKIIQRRDFVSVVVDQSLAEFGHTESLPIAKPIVEIILHDVLVDDQEWELGQLADSPTVDTEQTSRVLRKYLKETFDQFPPSEINEDDLDKIMAWLIDDLQTSNAQCGYPQHLICARFT